MSVAVEVQEDQVGNAGAGTSVQECISPPILWAGLETAASIVLSHFFHHYYLCAVAYDCTYTGLLRESVVLCFLRT